MKFLRAVCFVLIILGSGISLKAQENHPKTPEFLQYTNSTWVDSVMKGLTPNERIAQLIMVAAYSNRGEEHRQEILELIKNQKIGGLIFFDEGFQIYKRLNLDIYFSFIHNITHDPH